LLIQLAYSFYSKAKSVLMAIYFGADHFVWAYQIGLLNDKATGERVQKVNIEEAKF